MRISAWWLLLALALGVAAGRWHQAPPSKPLPQVVAFDSALVAARADSIARAEERARVQGVLLQLVAATAEAQRTIASAAQMNTRYHDLRDHVLATAASCGDSVRILLKADSLCRHRGDSLEIANGRLLQINREGQFAADKALRGQLVAEGNYSQFRNTAVDAIGALGTRLDDVLRNQRTHRIRLGVGGDLTLIGGASPCWTALAGPELVARRKLWIFEAEGRLTGGLGTGSCGKTMSTGPAGAAHLSVSF